MREHERLLAAEMSFVPTDRITKQEPIAAPGWRPDPHSVLAQEARGTREMVTSQQFPADVNKEQLKRIGVEIIGPSPGDELFLDIKLPEGWKKVPCNEDPRTTHLVDANGNRRAYAWYKAASYDRKANGGVNRRYGFTNRYLNDYKVGIAWIVDKKLRGEGRPVFRVIHTYETTKEGLADDAVKNLYAACKVWMDANIPDHDDVAAYWDAPDLPTAEALISYNVREVDVSKL